MDLLAGLLSALVPEEVRRDLVSRHGVDPPGWSCLVGVVEVCGGALWLVDDFLVRIRGLVDQQADLVLAHADRVGGLDANAALAVGWSGAYAWFLWAIRPFTLLVAVVLSAQTTDAQVNKVTPKLFALASTPEEMARLSEPQILDAIRSCGLAPSKAKNLKKLAANLVSDYGGRVPDSMEDLETLPGVGHKTASVVMTQAFGRPAFPVDTHIHRLARRWGLSRGKNVEQTERDLKKVFPEAEWGRRHLQIIYFGREHCPALRHDREGCPICGVL